MVARFAVHRPADRAGGFNPCAALGHFPIGMLGYLPGTVFSVQAFAAALTGDGKAEVLWASGQEVEALVNSPLKTRVYLPVMRK